MNIATRWSSEFIVAEHRDLQASAMAVDCTGMYALLAGRRYLGLKNLIDQNDSLKKFPRQSKYDVGTAEWSPHIHQKDLCAISTNKKIEVLSWAQSSLSLVHTLCAHTRAVSNLSWNHFDPNLLASCSNDTFTYIWDLRETRRPALSLSNVAGANQVKWNKQSRYLLASAHNGDVKLWDQRKGTAPVQYITAHLANIHCLDWNPNHENQLATSSQDCTVKFFDTANPKRADSVLTSAAPVWRARYTPFGNGLLMVVVPPMRRGENSLLLWNLANQTTPVHTFVGHTDVVLEFEWRKRPDSFDYQLITWSKDQTLRIWQIEPFLQKLCAIENGNVVDSADPSESILTTNGVIVNSVVESTVLVDGRSHTIEVPETVEAEPPPVIANTTQPKTLHQEFSLVNVNIRNVTFDLMDPVKRKCTVTASTNGNVVNVLISFPPGYPQSVAPSFQFSPTTTVDSALKNKLLKVLKQTAQQRVKRNRSCLEPCIRQLVAALEEASQADEADQTQYLHMQGALLQHPSLYSLRDAYIPFPRTSGAKFCNVGLLVRFGRTLNNGSLRSDKATPRSLSALNNYSESPLTVPAYYFGNRGQARSRLGRNLSSKPSKGSKTTVVVYDASALFPMRKDLAQKYINDVVGMCQKNSQVALALGRKDLAQVWSLASLAATPLEYDEDDDFPWESHPLSIGMIQSLIKHYLAQCDIQTVAMLCCAFGNKVTGPQSAVKPTAKTGSSNVTNSPYLGVDQSVESWNCSVTQNQSYSWPEPAYPISANEIVIHSPVNTESEKASRVSLTNSESYERYKLAYAEILHRWYLLDARAQVMKYVRCDTEMHQGLEPVTECTSCQVNCREAFCSSCNTPALQCVICHTSVKGAATVCLVCGHGGHSQHLYSWFADNDVCPSGCGCQCLHETVAALEP